MALERISLELTNRCGKACAFCYNGSSAEGATEWQVGEVLHFVEDCADHGVRAVSFGGGEPLLFEGLFDVLRSLRGRLFRSFTTNGLGLDARMARVFEARPDKIHISVHEPADEDELDRVLRQVVEIDGAGIKSGINLLVRRSDLAAASAAARRITLAGVGPERVMFLPMRGRDTPTASELAKVAGHRQFQSMTCLLRCGRSPRFASIGWNKDASHCSYTRSRRPLETLDFAGLSRALTGLGLEPCATDEATPKRALHVLA